MAISSLPDDVQRQRAADVRHALENDLCISDLARTWSLSRSGATDWCRRNVSLDDQRRLADNGSASIGRRKRDFDLPARLELIALCRSAGWSLEKIGSAVGVSYLSLWYLLRRHAPDGLDAALEDFREEEAA